MSGPRWMTLAVSLGGIAIFAVMYRQLVNDPVQSVGVGFLFFGLPFVLGAAVSVISMQKRTRIMLFWLTSIIMVFTGALTLFSVGIYNAIAVIFFLLAAWMENESGEPFIPKRRGSITTNPRTLPRP